MFKEFIRTEDEETELRQQFSSAFALETIIGQYTFGTPEGSVGPDDYSLDYYYVNLPGRAEMQNDLILDYCSNVALYPEFQKYLRDNQPPLLAVWGENDPSFIPAGANAFKRDVPNADIHFVPSGHFALESHHTEIARLMKGFLKRVLYFPSLYSSGVMAVRRLKYLEKKAGLGKLRSSEI